MKHLYYFLFLLWVSYLLVSSILLFSGGFLLSRTAQPYKATCLPYTPVNCSIEKSECYLHHVEEFKVIQFEDQICVPTDYKVILLVIDALRHDFTEYNPLLDNPLPYQNKLPILHKLIQNEPSSSRLYKFVADPPTTTLQRLKGLTAGNLPTFIDAGSNFGTEEVNEDNIIDQLVASGKKVVFMGDDTWMGLYPKRFLRSYPFPSFNVYDLDTVDNGVRNNLGVELREKDWDLLIGHFLGVDHCGHRYGPLHTEMARKLSEMNKIIENVVENLDNKTLLFVIGDHGMTINGDHGGASDDEINSAMFVYSKVPLKKSKFSYGSEIRQVDLVPTLATLFGVPIPYSNLGSLVLDAIPLHFSKHITGRDWHSLVIPLWSNLKQTVKYIEEYSGISDVFIEDEIAAVRHKFSVLKNLMKKMDDEIDFLEFQKETKEIIDFVYMICGEVWSQFDPQLISQGIILNFVILYLVYIIVDGIPTNKLDSAIKISFLRVSFILMVFAIVIVGVLNFLSLVSSLLYSVYLLTGIISAFLLAVVVIRNWETITINWNLRSQNKTWFDFLNRFILLFHVLVPLANSFVVEESYVSFYLLASISALIVLECIYPIIDVKSSNREKWFPFKFVAVSVVLIALILLRISPNFWRCREEQSWCTLFSTHHLLKSGTDFAQKYYILTVILLAMFVILGRNWLRSCGNLNGSSWTALSYRYLPTTMVVCIGSFWILEKMPMKKRKSFYFSNPKYFALCVYFIALELIVSAVLKPLCVHIVPKGANGSGDGIRTVPHVYQRLKDMLNEDEKKEGQVSNIPIVYGLATVYSAPFVIVIVTGALVLALLLGCASAAALVMMCLFAILFLFVSSSLRHIKASNSEDLLNIPNSVLIGWMLISHYCFYATGHQPTFPNIPWEAGFVGNSGDFTSHVIPAIQIIVNIFGSYMLMGFAVPLLFIAPFTLALKFPHFFVKKHNSDAKTGEMFLYQSNEQFIKGVFVACCKYILLHGMQVFLCMFAATLHCRHLMVWKIFAPKFIFQSISFFVTLFSVSIGYLFLLRINSKVNKLFEQEL